MGPMEIHLTPEMQQIIDDSLTDGLCHSPEEATLLALRQWRSDCLAASIGPDKLQEVLRKAASDTRPGKPAEEVFARLVDSYRDPEQSRHTADAA